MHYHSLRSTSRARVGALSVLRARSLAPSLVGLVALVLSADRAPGADPDRVISSSSPTQLFWGDTHLHTAYSLDGGFNGTSLSPADAYRFARGETITATGGQRVQLRRPLDFLVVADHAEYLGAVQRIRAGDPALLTQKAARDLGRVLETGDVTGAPMLMIELARSYDLQKPIFTMPIGDLSPWRDMTRLADAANSPGRFTAFAGYEWTSMPKGDNLHRVVVFRDGAERTNRIEPFTAFDSNAPEDLWRFFERYERETGGRALSIPHNSNLSGGRMFAESDFEGGPISAEYARLRATYEPVMEVTQIKGDSETHPLLSPDDEFVDYGTWDKLNIDMSTPQTPAMFPAQYARSALGLGLRVGKRVGVNPFAFGMIGSTDAHTGLAAIDEDDYWGKFTRDVPSATRAARTWGKRAPENPEIQSWEMLASGYAAVWATENTREAVFDAMKRREVYASTGPRITVRVFGGWHLDAQDLAADDVVARGYAKGVPMGGVLPAKGWLDRRPSFLVWALKDPEKAHLDRIQIVKGWLERDGRTLREKVYDVAWSGDRRPDAGGKLPAVGNTVDLATATYTNSIGAAELRVAWTDPDFDPALPAFYYVRVLEIPTPRWVAYDEARLGARLAKDAERTHQERIYTSPIWYQPKR